MRSWGGVPWVRTLSAVLVGAGLLVGGRAGDDGGDRSRAEASPKPPVELNDELTVANVAVEHEKPCRKNELEHTSMCYRLGDGFSTRRVKNLQLLEPDPKMGRLNAAVRVDFESSETALLAEVTERAHKAYTDNPYAPESKIAVLYGKDEVVVVAAVDRGPMADGSMQLDPGTGSARSIRDLFVEMTG